MLSPDVFVYLWATRTIEGPLPQINVVTAHVPPSASHFSSPYVSYRWDPRRLSRVSFRYPTAVGIREDSIVSAFSTLRRTQSTFGVCPTTATTQPFQRLVPWRLSTSRGLRLRLTTFALRVVLHWVC